QSGVRFEEVSGGHRGFARERGEKALRAGDRFLRAVGERARRDHRRESVSEGSEERSGPSGRAFSERRRRWKNVAEGGQRPRDRARKRQAALRLLSRRPGTQSPNKRTYRKNSRNTRHRTELEHCAKTPACQ